MGNKDMLLDVASQNVVEYDSFLQWWTWTMGLQVNCYKSTGPADGSLSLRLRDSLTRAGGR